MWRMLKKSFGLQREKSGRDWLQKKERPKITSYFTLLHSPMTLRAEKRRWVSNQRKNKTENVLSYLLTKKEIGTPI